MPARFYFWKNPPLKKKGVWFHSCSFGEAKAIKPLVEQVPTELLRMSTTTATGLEALQDYTKQSRFLPFEPLLFFWMRPQKVLVVMEAEFWYLLFSLAKMRGAKTLLVNARMSDRSYPKYVKMRWVYVQIFKYIDEVYAQTSKDKERLETLGAKNVMVTGNIKLSTLPTPDRVLEKPFGLIVCAASTHKGEEPLILDAFFRLKEKECEARLVLAPRHPERFDEAAELIEQSVADREYGWHRYSENESLEDDVVLVDTLGELVNIYAVSDIVILGGAFEPVGGHNAAEAAQFGCKIISGMHYFNQKDIFSAVEGIEIVKTDDLAERLQQHHEIVPAKIIQRSDISPIVESIKKVV